MVNTFKNCLKGFLHFLKYFYFNNTGVNKSRFIVVHTRKTEFGLILFINQCTVFHRHSTMWTYFCPSCIIHIRAVGAILPLRWFIPFLCIFNLVRAGFPAAVAATPTGQCEHLLPWETICPSWLRLWEAWRTLSVTHSDMCRQRKRD